LFLVSITIASTTYEDEVKLFSSQSAHNIGSHSPTVSKKPSPRSLKIYTALPSNSTTSNSSADMTGMTRVSQPPSPNLLTPPTNVDFTNATTKLNSSVTGSSI
jgi:hypothetical protein